MNIFPKKYCIRLMLLWKMQILVFIDFDEAYSVNQASPALNSRNCCSNNSMVLLYTPFCFLQNSISSSIYFILFAAIESVTVFALVSQVIGFSFFKRASSESCSPIKLCNFEPVSVLTNSLTTLLLCQPLNSVRRNIF